MSLWESHPWASRHLEVHSRWEKNRRGWFGYQPLFKLSAKGRDRWDNSVGQSRTGRGVWMREASPSDGYPSS